MENENNINESILAELQEASKVLNDFLSDKNNIKNIELASQMMIDSIINDGKIISCGNGGSSCDAAHFSEELTGRYRLSREPIASISISDSSHITCVANDFGYNQIFSRFIKAVGKKNDILLAISTSGNSENIINAVNIAKIKGLKVITLTGNDGGKLKDIADINITVPHFGFSDRIQEVHIKIIHILIMLIEKGVLKNKKTL